MPAPSGAALRAKAPPFGYLAPLGSPLLANIYLHPLDAGVNECRKKPRMIRYADDLVILCRPREGPEMRERLARWLPFGPEPFRHAQGPELVEGLMAEGQSRGLALNEAKTRVLQSRESGFKFLGFSFRWLQSKKGTPCVHTEPSPAAEPFRQAPVQLRSGPEPVERQGPEPAEGQAPRDRVRELTGHHTTWRERGEAVREINQMTRGWGNYFALANCHRSFGQMNDFIAHRLRQWLWRKHGNPAGKYERWPSRELFAADGLYRLRTAL